MHSPFQPEGEKLWGRETEQGARRLSEWMARSACGGAAGSVARVSVSRGDAPEAARPEVGAGGRPRGSDDPGGYLAQNASISVCESGCFHELYPCNCNYMDLLMSNDGVESQVKTMCMSHDEAASKKL